MSVHAVSWVLKNSEATKGDRLVLLAIADHASADGTDSWASVQTLAHEARLSERATRYCLRSLEAAGAIVDEGAGPRGTHNYTVIMEGQELPGAEIAGGQVTAEGGQPTAPEPSLEPLSVSEGSVVPLTAKDARGVSRARVEQAPQKLGKIGGKAVKPGEVTFARVVLNEWNRLTNQSLTSDDWLRMIVRRVREHPDLGMEEHAHIITTALAEPWWDGHPSPNVVYGNGAQFERCLTNARNGPAPPKRNGQAMRYGRGMTPGQILDATRGLK